MTTKQIFKNTLLALLVFSLSIALGFGVKVATTTNPLKVKWSDAVGTIKTDFAYGDQPSQKFDLYLPADKSKSSYGLVVYLHAGGFAVGDKSDDMDTLKYFTSKGFVASGINYTLASEKNPNANVLTMTNEIREAVPKVVEQAKKLGYNVDRMAVMGGSAGGALAMVYAYRDGKMSPVPIKFVMYQVAPSSFEPSDWYGKSDDLQGAAAWVSMMSGVPTTPEMMKSGEYKRHLTPISGYEWVNEQSPPTLCAFGKLDKVMPFTTTPKLFDALKKYNVPHDCYIYEHSGHGLHRDKDQREKFYQSLNQYLDKYLK